MTRHIFSCAFSLLLLVSMFGFSQDRGNFAPPEGKTLVVIGQDKLTINDYLKKVGPTPAGLMFYTATTSAAGLDKVSNTGAGDVYANYFLKKKEFSKCIIQLALWMVGDLEAVYNGERDENIDKIGNWIKACGQPVYFRIGYEFDGEWNHYEPEPYKKAYRYIVDRYRAAGINNAVYVWNSATAHTYKNYDFKDWWPGDGYVDWVGLSIFHQFTFTLGTPADIESRVAFAKEKGLPVAISESTPYGGTQEDKKWKYWFEEVFSLIEKHDIRMFSFIDADWTQQEQFAAEGWGDCRIEANPSILENWQRKMKEDRFIQNSDQLFELIGFRLQYDN